MKYQRLTCHRAPSQHLFSNSVPQDNSYHLLLQPLQGQRSEHRDKNYKRTFQSDILNTT